VLRVVTPDLDSKDDCVVRGIDESDAVGELDRSGDEAAVGRDIDPSGDSPRSIFFATARWSRSITSSALFGWSDT